MENIAPHIMVAASLQNNKFYAQHADNQISGQKAKVTHNTSRQLIRHNKQ